MVAKKKPAAPTKKTDHQKPEPQAADVKTDHNFAYLTRLLREKKPDSLTWLYEVGETMQRLSNLNAKHRYGGKVVEMIAEALEPDQSERCRALLYRGRRLAMRLEPAEFKRLAQHVAGERLTCRHVIHLALLDTKEKDKRNDFLRRCLAQKWSARRLQREIRQHIGHPRRAGGRRVEPPVVEGLAAALRDVSVLSRRWVAYAKSWCEGEQPLWQHPPADNLPEVRRELERATAVVEELLNHASRVRARLTEIQTETALVKRTKSHGSAGR